MDGADSFDTVDSLFSIGKFSEDYESSTSKFINVTSGKTQSSRVWYTSDSNGVLKVSFQMPEDNWVWIKCKPSIYDETQSLNPSDWEFDLSLTDEDCKLTFVDAD